MSYEEAVKEMLAGDAYEEAAMKEVGAALQDRDIRGSVHVAIVYALLSLRATLKADSEMRMDSR